MIATNLYDHLYELLVQQLSYFEILFLNDSFGIVAPFEVALVASVTSARRNKITIKKKKVPSTPFFYSVSFLLCFPLL